MGEIADDMIDGACCSYCGVYFEQEHGYPVICDHCWNDEQLSEQEKRELGFQKATHREL